MMDKLDPRLNAYRPDIADIRLKGRVCAEKFITGEKKRVMFPLANIYQSEDETTLMSQLLMGDEVQVFDTQNGFSFIQSIKDHYVGYVGEMLLDVDTTILSHYVSVRSTFLYPEPHFKSLPIQNLSLGTKLAIVDFVETGGMRYGLTKNGCAIFSGHLTKIQQQKIDYVTVAEGLSFTPYLWGGVSAFGIDCSGLVQLSMAVAGHYVLRDSDMQFCTIGQKISFDAQQLQRGDLIFWPGHVAIMQDRDNSIHANGASMDVRSEVLNDIIERIGKPLGIRRPNHIL